MEKTEKIIALNIRTLRINKGWTQSDLADKADVSLRGIQAIENEGRIPRAVTIGRIAVALDVALDDLYRDPHSQKKTAQSRPELLGLIVSDLPALNDDELRRVLIFLNDLRGSAASRTKPTTG